MLFCIMYIYVYLHRCEYAHTCISTQTQIRTHACVHTGTIVFLSIPILEEWFEEHSAVVRAL